MRIAISSNNIHLGNLIAKTQLAFEYYQSQTRINYELMEILLLLIFPRLKINKLLEIIHFLNNGNVSAK